MFQLKPLSREKIASLVSKVFYILHGIILLYTIIWFVNSILNSLLSPSVPLSTSYDEWAVENDTSPYVVWGASIKSIINEDCQGWTCNGKDLRKRDPEIWQLIGKGEYGKTVFTFDQPMDTFVIASKEIIGFDVLSGTTVDGKKVTFGYLTDGTLTTPYLDGDNMPLVVRIMSAKAQNTPFTEPCGMIDPNFDGDNNFSITIGKGTITWNFSNVPWDAKGHPFDKVYSLTSLSIISQPASKITSSQKCP